MQDMYTLTAVYDLCFHMMHCFLLTVMLIRKVNSAIQLVALV